MLLTKLNKKNKFQERIKESLEGNNSDKVIELQRSKRVKKLKIYLNFFMYSVEGTSKSIDNEFLPDLKTFEEAIKC